MTEKKFWKMIANSKYDKNKQAWLVDKFEIKHQGICYLIRTYLGKHPEIKKSALLKIHKAGTRRNKNIAYEMIWTLNNM